MRPRIRTIKPELFRWEPFGRLPDQLQVLFCGLVSMADDDGRLQELPLAIIGHVFPYKRISPRRVTVMIATLGRGGLVQRYEAGGERLLSIVGWHEHGHPLYQRINRRTDSRLPAPPADGVSPDQGVFLTEASVRPHVGNRTRNRTERSAAG